MRPLLQRRHLEALVAVDEHRSVHAAARALGLPQPALSRLVSEAEALLGTRVFERSSKGSQPLPRAVATLAQARFVLRGLERLGAASPAAPPVVRLGCIARGMHSVMPPLLERVYPVGSAGGDDALRLRLVEGSSTALMQAVAQANLDFAILRSIGSPAAHCTVEPLYDERTVVICGVDNAQAPAGPVALRELAGHDWVLPDPQTASRAAFERVWAEHVAAALHPVIEARSFETNLALVGRSRFLSIAPESIARRHAAYGVVRIVEVGEVLPPSPISLVFASSAPDDPVLAGFRTLIHAAAAQARSAG